MKHLWSHAGSERGRSRQINRLFINMLLGIAQSGVNSIDEFNRFHSLVVDTFKANFLLSDDISMEEQLEVLYQSLGWMNIVFDTNDDEIRILLGSNRLMPYDESKEDGIIVLVKSIIDGSIQQFYPNKIWSRVQVTRQGDEDEFYSIYVDLDAGTITDDMKTKENLTNIPSVVKPEVTEGLDPILLLKPIPETHLSALQFLGLNRAMADYLNQHNRSSNLPNISASPGLTLKLMTLLVDTSGERSALEIGREVGNIWSGHLVDKGISTPSKIFSSKDPGQFIVEIPTRSLCYLSRDQTCETDIGGTSRKYCDLVMGVWEAVINRIQSRFHYTFETFYPAGSVDKWCLMEFTNTRGSSEIEFEFNPGHL